MTAGAVWPSLPDAEKEAFYAIARVFLGVANALEDEETAARVGAAFLYASARFTAFSMEAQTGDHAAVDAATRDWLTKRFDEDLRDHAAQKLRVAPRLGPAGQVPDAVIDILAGLESMDPARERSFLRLADRFIHPANEMIGEVAIWWISGAMLHASARFNAYVMQSRGLPPGPLRRGVATDFSNAFRALLDFHLGQSTVTER